MRIRNILGTAAVLAAGLFAVGCGTSPTGGGSSGTKQDGTAVNKSDTFNVKQPTVTPTIKHGETKAVTITLDRGKDFKDSVTLKTGELPKGLKVEMPKATVAASDPADVVLNITADKEAAVGEQTIKVMATPDKGKETVLDLKVKVEAPK